MKKLLAVLVAGLALVACSHNEQSSASATEASAPAVEASAPEASAAK